MTELERVEPAPGDLVARFELADDHFTVRRIHKDDSIFDTYNSRSEQAAKIIADIEEDEHSLAIYVMNTINYTRKTSSPVRHLVGTVAAELILQSEKEVVWHSTHPFSYPLSEDAIHMYEWLKNQSQDASSPYFNKLHVASYADPATNDPWYEVRRATQNNS